MTPIVHGTSSSGTSLPPGLPPVLFENDDILAVNKPEGIASVAERHEEKENLFSRLSSKAEGKLYVVHRLDKEASGVILFAKNAGTHRFLNEQFSHWTIKKTYVALAHGVITEEDGTIDRPLRQFGSGRMGIDPDRGKACRTKFVVTERFRRATLLRVHPLSGRRHQIRVHLYSIGHPILGDRFYGDRATQREFARLMLHAEKIAFLLPPGEELTVEAPLPESFQVILDAVAKNERPRAPWA